ncbi:MAG: hypothetical protein QME49_01600 [bacterium]|nr:hypothetical protein [bacterium]
MPYTLQQATIILLLLLSANISDAATAFKFGQPVQSIRAGDSFELPTLTAVDGNGNPDTAYNGTHTLFCWGPQNGPISGTPSYTTEVQFASGTNTTPLITTMVCAEAITLWVRDSVNTNIVGSLTLNVMPASPHALMIVTEYPKVNAGYTFTTTVTAIDIYGNVADTYAGDKFLSWTHTASTATYVTASPIIPQNAARTFIQGKTTIPGFVLFNASETPVINVSDSLITGSLEIKVDPGKNDCFNITTEHNNTETVGIGFGVNLTIIDPYGNLTGTPSGTLHVSCDWDAATSSNGIRPQKPADKDIDFTSGKAFLGTFTLTNAREMPRITVRSGTLISGTSSTIAVNASSPETLQLFSMGTAWAGDAFRLGTITVYDAFGNTATTYSGSKTVTYNGPNNGTRTGSPAYTTDVFFDRGISITSLLTTLVCAETTTVTVKADGMTGNSNQIIVLPGSANLFELVTQHHGIETAGVPFSIDITAKDIFGNIASKYEGIHNINCWWNATGSVSPTKPDVIPASFSSGQATVGSFTLTNTQQTPIISFYENIRGTTTPITVKPATNIHHLQLITEHQGAETAGVPFAVKVLVCDQLGNPTEYTGTEWIDWAWENAATSTWGIPPALPISGSYTFRAGSFTTDGFKLTNALDTPIIHAQSGTITGSSTITVSPGQAASLKIVAPTPVIMDVSFNLASITAYDICGNTATTYTGSKVLTYKPAGTGTSYTSPVYFEQGVSKNILQTTLTKAETVQIHVTDKIISGTSNPITIKPGSITCLEVTTEHQGTETAGRPFSVILTLKDKSGNTVTDYNSSTPVVWSWTAGNSPNNGTPSKPVDGNQSFTNGTAVISGFTLTRAGEFPGITAIIGSLTGSSQGITVKADEAYSFRITAPNTATAGASFTLTNITALDIFGNIAAEYSGTKSLVYSGPSSGPISGEPIYPPQIVSFASGISAQRLEMRLVRAEETSIRVEQGNISGYSQKIVVTPASPGRFILSTTNHGTETAGHTFTMTIIARDSFGNDANGYTALHPLIWSWDATLSPKGMTGFLPANGNQKFDGGIANVGGFILANATQTTISVSDHIFSGTITINVIPDKASYFDISLPSIVTINQPFLIKSLVARDDFGNIAVSYSGTMPISFAGPGTDSSGNKPSYPLAILFEQGVASSTTIMPMAITLRKPETVCISLMDGNAHGTSSQIEVVALKAGCLVWPHEVYAHATQTINYSVTNTGDNEISQIRINIPDGFTYIDASIPQVSTNQLWSAIGSSNGQCVLLTPNDTNNYLPQAATLIVSIHVSTQENEHMPVKWTSMITGRQGAIVLAQEVIDGDSEVSITAYILSCNVSSNEVLPGGAATVTAKLIYQPTGQPEVGKLVTFSVVTNGQTNIPMGTAATNDSGQAYINIPAGTTTGSITVEAKYGLFNIQRVCFQVISPIPKLSAGKGSLVKEGITYVNPATPFSLTPSGSFTCLYRLDSGLYQKFSQPFTIDSPGEHVISYRYVDASGHHGYEYTANIYVSLIPEKLTNFPNPFNPLREETTIQYYLTRPADVLIQTYNLFGELVWMRNVSAGQQGSQQVPWNGRNGDGEMVGNGSFICRVIIKYPSGDVIMTRKIGVVK